MSSLESAPRVEAASESFLAFSIEAAGEMRVLTIPRPLVDDDGYTLSQLGQIEKQLARFELEILPIDMNLYMTI